MRVGDVGVGGVRGGERMGWEGRGVLPVCACVWRLSLLCEPSAGFLDRTNTPNAIGLGGKVTSLDQSPGGWGSRMRWEGYRGWVGQQNEVGGVPWVGGASQ